MKKTIQQCKDEVAREANWDDFNDLLLWRKENPEAVNKLVDRAMTLYASQEHQDNTRSLDENGLKLLDELAHNLGKTLWQWENPMERGYELSDRIVKYLESTKNK